MGTAWHDIFSNPNDLPREYTDVLVTAICGRNGVSEKYVFIAQYDGLRKYWTNCDSEIIIAWMEMPKPFGE